MSEKWNLFLKWKSDALWKNKKIIHGFSVKELNDLYVFHNTKKEILLKSTLLEFGLNCVKLNLLDQEFLLQQNDIMLMLTTFEPRQANLCLWAFRHDKF